MVRFFFQTKTQKKRFAFNLKRQKKELVHAMFNALFCLLYG